MKTNSYLKPARTHNGSVKTDLPLTLRYQGDTTKMGKKILVCSVFIVLLANITSCRTIKNPVNVENHNRHQIGKFEKSPCPFDLPEGLIVDKNMIFGYVTVPEKHKQPNGPTIRLAVAIFPSFSETPSPAPLVLNSTGPGTSAMEDFVPNFAGGDNPILAHCDAVVIELRGLHYSEPNLLCKERCDMLMATLDEDLGAEEMMTHLLKSIRASHDRFVRTGVNVAAFNNVETAADIAMVMSALGYERFNLFGNSAGTIIAQHMMRDYPERLRCVILSSPVPLGTNAFQSSISNAIKTLQQLFKLCALDKECNSAFPHLEANFLKLLEKLNAHPVTVPIQDPATDKTFDLVLNGDRLAQWLFMRMFLDPQFPIDLGKIIAGDYTTLQENAWVFFPMYTFSYGLGNSIMLSEEAESPPENAVIPDSYSVFARAVSAGGFGPEFIQRVRRVWNVPMLESYAREPVKCDVPTLILCGEFDHMCPPRYAQLMAKNLSNAYLYTFPGVAHSPIDAGPCAISMAFDFLKDPTRTPDSSCIEEYEFHFKIDP